MKRTLLILITLCLILPLSGRGDSNDDYISSEISSSQTISETAEPSQSSTSVTSSETTNVDDTSWDYVINNHNFVSYEDVKSEKYNNQFVILSTTIDNVEYVDIMNWVKCDAWFVFGNSYICDKITFMCDEIPNYSPQSLQSGDNVDICVYVNSDSSFGSKIKAFNKNNNQTSLDEIYVSFKENCSVLNWEEIMRSPENFRGTTYTLTAQVFQVVSEKNGYVELLLYDSKYVFASYSYKENDLKILEDDIVTIYGTFYKPYDYTSVLGTSHSVPSIVVQFIQINE